MDWGNDYGSFMAFMNSVETIENSLFEAKKREICIMATSDNAMKKMKTSTLALIQSNDEDDHKAKTDVQANVWE